MLESQGFEKGAIAVGWMRRMRRRIVAGMGETRRQNMLAAASVALAATVVIVALVGAMRLAVAGLAVMLLAVVLVLLDLRRRMGAMAQRMKRDSLDRSRHEPRPAGPGDQAGRIDAMNRRLIAAIESGRLEAIDRHDEMLTALRKWRSSEQLATTEPGSHAAGRTVQVDGLLGVVDLVQRMSPALVVELGSGASSVWLGYALRRSGGGAMVSIDHDDNRAEVTRAAVESHELSRVVAVRTAAVADVNVDGRALAWYNARSLDDLGEIDMLVVDRLASPNDPDVRPAAVPVLADRLADNALIIVDDAHSPAGVEIVETWMRAVPGLENVTSGPDANPSVLRYRKTG